MQSDSCTFPSSPEPREYEENDNEGPPLQNTRAKKAHRRLTQIKRRFNEKSNRALSGHHEPGSDVALECT